MSRSETWPIPEGLVAHARAFAASGAAPAVPRRAATVVLLRPTLEVYLMRRAATMAFAPNMYAFPGGAVDPSDSGGAPGPSAWGPRLGLPEDDARAVLRAAVREVAEETGVRLDPDRLAPWDRWLTPEFEPRRYDTFFFLAQLPDGQEPVRLGGEAAHTVWLPPAEAARLPMLPPTAHTLRGLCGYQDIESALAAAGDRLLTAAVTPRFLDDRDGPRLVISPL